MKQVRLLFDEGKIELHMGEQNGIEWIDYSELKKRYVLILIYPVVFQYWRLILKLKSSVMNQKGQRREL